MGMSDRQFDVLQKKTLRELQHIQAELKEMHGIVNDKLEVMIKDIEEQLQRP